MPSIFRARRSGTNASSNSFASSSGVTSCALGPSALSSRKRRRSPISTRQRGFSELKSLGCLFSLDDFGAGMSSFGYLKHLPVDFLKIDGSFVKDVAHDPVDLAMVRAINDVGHVMGKKTIGEAVDGEMGLAALREIGVDFAQGHWLSPPGPFLAQVAAGMARTATDSALIGPF